MAKRKNPAAVALGRKGGKQSSEAKAAAAKANGAKGGRPRIRCKDCRRTEEKKTAGGRWGAIALDANGMCRACREAEAEAASNG